MGVVTEDVATGLVVLQVKVVLQLLAPEAIVQLVAESVPDMGGAVMLKLPQEAVLPATVAV